MEVKEKTTFETLYAIDVAGKLKEKNKLTYLSWASAWAEVKKVFPNAASFVHEQIMDEYGNTRPWFDDGKTGWVKVTVIVNDIDVTETLPIMDFKNKSLAAESITSMDANKAIKRCLVKALAMHGLAMYVYEGEDIPEEVSKVQELQAVIGDLINKKAKLSDTAKNKVQDLCIKAEKDAKLDLDEYTGRNVKAIENVEVLEKLKKGLLAVKK